MSLDKLVNDAKTKLGTVGVLVLLLVSLHDQVGEMKRDLGTLRSGLVEAQLSLERAHTQAGALEERVRMLELQLHKHIEQAQPFLLWDQAMRRWEAEGTSQPSGGRR